MRAVLACLAVMALACSEAENGGVGDACAEDDDCLTGQECVARVCTAVDAGRSRDLGGSDGGGTPDAPGPDSANDDVSGDTGPLDAAPDGVPDLAPDPSPDTTCTPNCAGQACGPDPVCGTECGPCPEDQSCNISNVCVPTGGDPLANLSPQCATFCTELCEFLLACGKEDPLCLPSCGASTRYQQLSTAACDEGTAAIQLEECPLWLNCGGDVCAIDEMCLGTLSGNRCALICDQQQATPACGGGTSCRFIADANGNFLTSLGLCANLF